MRTRFMGIVVAVVAAALVTAGPVILRSESHAQSGGTDPADKPVFKYAGTKTCEQCHTSKVTGNQMKPWKDSAHSRAYEVLLGDAARKITDAKHIDTPPEKTPLCLSCHTTGAGEAKSHFTKEFDLTEGVTCEACHGPGGEYSKIQHMLKHENAIAMGLLSPDAKTCIRCHNADSPTFKGFDYPTAMKQIAHPLAPF